MNDLTRTTEHIIVAAGRPDVISAMGQFYDTIERRIAELPHTCWNRGACCRFGAYGHRLYVTTLEAAYHVARLGEHTKDADLLDIDVCQHAVGGVCCARETRPMGCRVFFCDPAAAHWQGPLTEEMLQQLREMHHLLDVPYCYVDWIATLRSIRRRMDDSNTPTSADR